MFVTVTANPSVDRTIEVDRLVRGELHRASRTQVHPGGKGVNVARALVRNGVKTRAVVPVGGAEGAQLVALLTADSVDVVRVPTTGSVRCNVSVVEPDGTVTKLNEAGPSLTPADAEAIRDAALANIADATWVVLAGSLPPGAPVDFYADLVARLTGEGVRVAVDTSGPALVAAVAAQPALIKPNLHELEEAVGRELPAMADVVAAAHELRERGAGAVLASLGGEGAVLVDGEGVWHAEAAAEVRSSVGAGDALLAGFLSAGGQGPEALSEAVAWGAAAVSLPGSTMPGVEDIKGRVVRVARIDS
ncbi:1-phosphofructokinase [Amycolatopsis xylanica]|uniref:1-phosphofructokinase n=1 Tax=Amycolatopsis xylanica TaxID=589385 RepID=A0A1H3H028_9PSEU|nr:1-phosphofructokinase [Amycolatopsis xylanica]SDY08268.1 1-phosphofructokinase [Amycolatopsis xylanica]